MLNSPLSFTDPNGDCPICAPIIIGAMIGGMLNGAQYDMSGKGFLNGFWRGAITGGVGGALGAFAPVGVFQGMLYGAGSGAITGGLGAVLNGDDIAQGALYGAVGGAVFGGISGGIGSIMTRSAMNDLLFNPETALAQNGDPKYVPNSRPDPNRIGVIAPRLRRSTTTPLPIPWRIGINWGGIGAVLARSLGVVLSLATIVEGDVPRNRPPRYPIYHVYEELTPHIYQNTVAAQASGQPSILTYAGPNDPGTVLRRRAATAGTKKVSGFSADEYPFASTLEGGAGSRVMLVPYKEQLRQGGQLNAFYSSNRMTAGQKFYVLPIPR